MSSQPSPDDPADAFASFYETQLRPVVPKVLAEKTRNTRVALVAGLAVFGAAFAFSCLFPDFFSSPGRPGNNWFSMLLFAAAMAAITWRLLARRHHRTGLTFREHILQPMAVRFTPEVRYEPEGALAHTVYGESLLFDRIDQGDRFVDSGLFSGQDGDRRFAFTALRAERGGREGCHLRSGSMFEGLFFTIANRDRTKGFMLITPKSAGLTREVVQYRLGDRISDEVRELTASGVHNFDQLFSVFIPDRQDAPTLPPAIPWLLLEARDSWHAFPWLSLVDDKLYFALLTNRKHFQPPAAGQSLDLAKCREYRRDLAMASRLAGELCGL